MDDHRDHRVDGSAIDLARRDLGLLPSAPSQHNLWQTDEALGEAQQRHGFGASLWYDGTGSG